MFSRKQIKTKSLKQRFSKTKIKETAISIDNNYHCANKDISKISKIIIKARKNNRPVILVFGAHLIKNGLSLVLRQLIKEGFITHLATNGAGIIHDWEFAFLGKSEEDVRDAVSKGEFGIWEETGKYINTAINHGAKRGIGLGQSVGEMIANDKFTKHRFKKYSVLDMAYKENIPFTVHPGFGYDIIHTHPLCNGSAIGKSADIDFLKFVDSVSRLNGGVYLSVGSAIMSPMIFEKSLSMSRNVAKQKGEDVDDFAIVVNDIQAGGSWKWGTGKEPKKTDPAYYLRFCKTFDRMGSREMYYVQADNRDFLCSLYKELKDNESKIH